MTFSLRVLGGARIEVDGVPVGGRAANRRRLAVLALLAASPRQSLTREKLIGYLWPDTPGDAGRQSLSESLSVIRRDVAEDAFLTAGDEVGLNRAVVDCDLLHFQDAVGARDWNRVVELYAGPFLDGFFVGDAPDFERWMEGQRAEATRSYGRALESLAEDAETKGDWLRAVECWGRLALHDPYNGRVALRLVLALAAAGERARAIQVADTFASRQREELGMEPDAEIVALAERLRTETREAPSPPPPAAGASAAQPSELLTPDFDVIRPIGAGSVATIFLAREPALARMVALKVLSERFADDEIVVGRFKQEGRAAGRILHPNVTPVYRVGHTTTGLPYMVLPYIDGGSLEDRLAATGTPSPEEARRYVGQIAAGLAAAHHLGIVHRDVRPANILYDRASDRVLVTDFGLAAVLEGGVQSGVRFTRQGELMGDPRFASPEQLLGEAVTERTDVYALGVVAFLLLTGRLPYDADTALQMTAAHVRDEPLRVSQVVEVEPALDERVHRCLDKRPERRPFAADIAEFLGFA